MSLERIPDAYQVLGVVGVGCDTCGHGGTEEREADQECRLKEGGGIGKDLAPNATYDTGAPALTAPTGAGELQAGLQVGKVVAESNGPFKWLQRAMDRSNSNPKPNFFSFLQETKRIVNQQINLLWQQIHYLWVSTRQLNSELQELNTHVQQLNEELRELRSQNHASSVHHGRWDLELSPRPPRPPPTDQPPPTHRAFAAPAPNKAALQESAKNLESQLNSLLREFGKASQQQKDSQILSQIEEQYVSTKFELNKVLALLRS